MENPGLWELDTGMVRWTFKQVVLDGQIYLSSTLKNFVHFYKINSVSSLTTSIGNISSLSSSSDPTSAPYITSFLLQNHAHLQTLAIEDAFPTTTTSVTIRNLTHLKIPRTNPARFESSRPKICCNTKDNLESLNLYRPHRMFYCRSTSDRYSELTAIPYDTSYSNVAGAVTPIRRLDTRDLFHFHSRLFSRQ
ncbi:hypothetical protein K435DRAFT_109119 [Dendrothele bispora CBS 962.96]|uniref:Uncharacterized protein n=1 Tax=Dendrothele bispora (strain CBS 962.96) TaxID=1314807 RepID=A0A4S8KNH8_DENBC|nr:hypothetical protein K435DRAFT_109119 [Dendrothele bispora CBS 962.96]